MLKKNTKKEKKPKEENKKKSIVPRYIIFLILSIILGGIFTALTSYAATIAASNISYSNTSSGLTATNTQAAIDEIYSKDIKCWWCVGILEAKTFNKSSCVTGMENTCVSTSCYKNKTAGSCPAGTILRIRVNNYQSEWFYVLQDTGNYLKLILSHNTLYTIPWNSSSNGNLGPTGVLDALESSVASWAVMETFQYTPGVSGNDVNTSGNVLGYNDQRHYNGSWINSTYTMTKRTTHGRLLTIKEAIDAGCNYNNSSCPWYLTIYNSDKEPGRVEYNIDRVISTAGTESWGYWTNNVYNGNPTALMIRGGLQNYITDWWANAGARPVTYIKKP